MWMSITTASTKTPFNTVWWKMPKLLGIECSRALVIPSAATPRRSLWRRMRRKLGQSWRGCCIWGWMSLTITTALNFASSFFSWFVMSEALSAYAKTTISIPIGPMIWQLFVHPFREWNKCALACMPTDDVAWNEYTYVTRSFFSRNWISLVILLFSRWVGAKHQIGIERDSTLSFLNAILLYVISCWRFFSGPARCLVKMCASVMWTVHYFCYIHTYTYIHTYIHTYICTCFVMLFSGVWEL